MEQERKEGNQVFKMEKGKCKKIKSTDIKRIEEEISSLGGQVKMTQRVIWDEVREWHGHIYTTKRTSQWEAPSAQGDQLSAL